MKKENYRQELDQHLNFKRQKENHHQTIQQEMARQDISNIQQYAQRELNNLAQYRSKFAHKDELMRLRQGNYAEQVMNPAMMKDLELNHVINARNDQYEKDQASKERYELHRRAAMSDDRQRSLER